MCVVCVVSLGFLIFFFVWKVFMPPKNLKINVFHLYYFYRLFSMFKIYNNILDIVLVAMDTRISQD